MERQTQANGTVAVGGAKGPTADMPESVLGVPASQTHPALQTDSFKELVNKLAWVLGSTYRVPYSNQKSVARQYALRITSAIMRDHGYPSKISVTETS